MERKSVDEILSYLRGQKGFLYDKFGVTRMGIFGSFAAGEQNDSSDVDILIEMDENKKNIHTFLQLKKFLEQEIEKKIDIGFEHSLKPVVKNRIKDKIIYV